MLYLQLAPRAKMIAGFDQVLEQSRPDLVLVHGDTTTALPPFIAA